MNLSIKFTVQCERGQPNRNGRAHILKSGLKLLDGNKKSESLKDSFNF